MNTDGRTAVGIHSIKPHLDSSLLKKRFKGFSQVLDFPTFAKQLQYE